MAKITILTLAKDIKALVGAARQHSVRTLDVLLLATNYNIGRLIVEYEQHGSARAGYADATLEKLAARLTADLGRGYSRRNLSLFRQFYLAYRTEKRIWQTPSAELKAPGLARKLQTLYAKSGKPFFLGWSHYHLLLRIDDAEERSFYEKEAMDADWSFRELKRQINSSLYERMVLSRSKNKVRNKADKGELADVPEMRIKDPYILEFLGLEERETYSESQLESAIIDKLEHFLLELGNGFLFEARQKRISLNDKHFYIDLVFYNRLLRSYVLIDLKIGELTHQDLGQMQMYVNYYDRHVKLDDENASIGIVLCKQKNDTLVEITLPENNTRIFASKYKLYLPSKAQLKKQIKDISV